MTLTYLPLNRRAMAALQEMLNDYYHEEDAVAQEGFIKTLLDLIRSGKILGNLVESEHQIAGFVLYAVDSRDSDFSELPGHGTILAMQVQEPLRRRGIGSQIVRHVENELRSRVSGFYVCSLGDSQCFWEACGYQASKETATNGEILFLKSK